MISIKDMVFSLLTRQQNLFSFLKDGSSLPIQGLCTHHYTSGVASMTYLSRVKRVLILLIQLFLHFQWERADLKVMVRRLEEHSMIQVLIRIFWLRMTSFSQRRSVKDEHMNTKVLGVNIKVSTLSITWAVCFQIFIFHSKDAGAEDKYQAVLEEIAECVKIMVNRLLLHHHHRLLVHRQF